MVDDRTFKAMLALRKNAQLLLEYEILAVRCPRILGVLYTFGGT